MFGYTVTAFIVGFILGAVAVYAFFLYMARNDKGKYDAFLDYQDEEGL